METVGVSDEMKALYDAQRRAHETVLTLQAQIEEEETVYLEETPHGNIIRGWDGFIDSKQPRKDANPKKIKPYSESEHLFSGCCFYSSMASGPSLDIYGTTKDESASSTRGRKLTVTLSVGKGAGASTSISGVVDGAAAHSSHAAYRGGKGSKLNAVQKTGKAPTHPATGKGATAQSYQHSKASKLKKRKREAEAAAAASAKAHETVAGGPQTATTVATTTNSAAGQPPASDFLDVL